MSGNTKPRRHPKPKPTPKYLTKRKVTPGEESLPFTRQDFENLAKKAAKTPVQKIEPTRKPKS